MRTGTANLPLHYGKAPKWLFQRMARLAREMTTVIVVEFGSQEMLCRLSDPFWFQSFRPAFWGSIGILVALPPPSAEPQKRGFEAWRESWGSLWPEARHAP